MTAHDSSTTDPRVVESEIAKEQAHVDRVRAQLEIAENKARMLAKAGQDMYRSDRTSWVREEDGTAMFERDAFSYNAAKRLAVLDAEHEGLVFGRLDLTDDEVRHIGRIGVRDADYEPLVIDWRARAAEPFTEPPRLIRWVLFVAASCAVATTRSSASKMTCWIPPRRRICRLSAREPSWHLSLGPATLECIQSSRRSSRTG
ncbi:helicase protein [Cutibacterium acnes JCM 18916]|nr:helicase protein [Cutibacterium acnes JCM 18916]